MTPDEMRRMGDTEASIRYWTTRQIDCNGQPVTVREPSRNYPNTETGD